MPRGNSAASLRRSNRNRRTTYETLEESVILGPPTSQHPAFHLIMTEANRRLGTEPSGTQRSLRSSRSKQYKRVVLDSSDDEGGIQEESEQPDPPLTRSTRGSRQITRRNRMEDEGEEEFLDIHSRVRRVRKPTNFYSPEESLSVARSSVYTSGQEESNQSFADQQGTSHSSSNRKPSRPLAKSEEDDDEDAGTTDTDEITEEGFRRKYQLREHKPAVKRFEILPEPSRPRRQCTLNGDWDSGARERPSGFPPPPPPQQKRHPPHQVAFRSPAQKRFWRRNKRRRTLDRRSTSSTSSSSSDDERTGVKDRDDERFNRRTAKSLERARERFLPLNLEPDEARRGVIRDRLRVVGASCSDIDPMNIDRSISFDSVGGLTRHVQSLKEMVLFPLMYPQVFERFKITPPRGVIFYGPPGTGKTLVARALANECSRGDRKVAFFMRKGADCLSKWVGESERQLRLLFDQAYTMRPSIIFFDELDGLAPVRSTRQDQIHSSIVSTLLALMDGLDQRGEVVVVGATNRLDSLDPALRRPGRFDRELGFSLPDRKARADILKIHTGGWQPPLEEDVLETLAEKTVGFCGADLKGICTEAALIALRHRYPQIYCSQQKLVLDMNKVKVTGEDFYLALSQLVPASQRGLSVAARPIRNHLRPLLQESLEGVLEKIPKGYFQQGTPGQENTELNEYQKVVSAMQPRSVVAGGRVLVCGQSAEYGQSSHVAPAVLHVLDHLTVYSLAFPQIYATSSHRSPEEAVAEILKSAVRTAGSTGGGPCVLFLPAVDEWFTVVPCSVWHTLVSTLETWDALTSVVILATAHREFAELPDDVKGLFRRQEAYGLGLPRKEQRRKFLESVLLEETKRLPLRYSDRHYEHLAVAPPDEPRTLSEAELKLLKEQEASLLRQLRIFLREMHGRLIRDRRFIVFTKPVDTEDAPDYYDIITNPMDLSRMMGKIDRHEYETAKAYLDDIDLITANALEYNPDRDTHDRIIRHKACDLSDAAHALIDTELDPEFERRIQEIKKSRMKRGDRIHPDPPPPFLLTKPKGAGMKRRELESEHFPEQPQEGSFNMSSARYSTRSRGPAPDLKLEEVLGGQTTPVKTSNMDASGTGSVIILDESPQDKSREMENLEQQIAAVQDQEHNYSRNSPCFSDVAKSADAGSEDSFELEDIEKVKQPEEPEDEESLAGTNVETEEKEPSEKIVPVKKEPVKRPAKRGLEAIWCKPKRRRISLQKKRKVQVLPRHKVANAIVKKYKTSRQKNLMSGSASGSSQRSSPAKRSPLAPDECSLEGSETGSTMLPDPAVLEPKFLIMDESKLREAVELGTEKTENWTVTALEKLSGKLTEVFERYANKWDRTGMAEEMFDEIEKIQSSDDV